MRKIFQGAKRVVAWLGEADSYVDLAFDTIEEICWAVKIRMWDICMRKYNLTWDDISQTVLDQLIEDGLIIQDQYATLYEFVRYIILSPDDKPVRRMTKALASFNPDYSISLNISVKASTVQNFKRCPLADAILLNDYKDAPLESLDLQKRLQAMSEVFTERCYWNRLWVVQELLSSSEASLMSGHRQLNFEFLTILEYLQQSAYEGLDKGSLLNFVSLECLTPMRGVMDLTMAHARAENTLATNLFRYSHWDCSVPHDHIFALLNISTSIRLRPDYTKSASEIFTEAMISIIKQEQSLDFICLTKVINAGKSHISCVLGLPSWVPDFTHPHYWPMLYTPGALSKHRRQPYDSGGRLLGSKYKNIDQKPGLLRMDGSFYTLIHARHRHPPCINFMTRFLCGSTF